jgi:hypothetical protein
LAPVELSSASSLHTLRAVPIAFSIEIMFGISGSLPYTGRSGGLTAAARGGVPVPESVGGLSCAVRVPDVAGGVSGVTVPDLAGVPVAGLGGETMRAGCVVTGVARRRRIGSRTLSDLDLRYRDPVELADGIGRSAYGEESVSVPDEEEEALVDFGFRARGRNPNFDLAGPVCAPAGLGPR